MRILVTGSAGHLGEAIVRTLRNQGTEVLGIDQNPSEFTDKVGTIENRAFVSKCMKGVSAVIHAATLHKPHIVTHSRQKFIDVNISGTLNLLEEATSEKLNSFIFTSSTSTYGDALVPPKNAPAAWITETVIPRPKNIYGTTKIAAEDLCQSFHRNNKLPCIVLKASRFFPEDDDKQEMRQAYDDTNAKANEFLHRRVDLEDVVSAHLLALKRAPAIGFARYIISATTPFSQDDLAELRIDAPAVLARIFPNYRTEYGRRGWKMFPQIDRVYVNQRARNDLQWEPRHSFSSVLQRLNNDEKILSPLAYKIGKKGYHATEFEDGPYPVESANDKKPQ